MFDLNTLLLFAKVVESGSYSEAARALNTPKSTISRKISQMEEHLDVRLLQRNTRQIQLTEVGQEVYQRSVRILEEAHGVRAMVESAREEVAGSLKVLVPVSFNHESMAELCTGFLQLHPKVDLELQFADGDSDIIGQNFDIAIKFGPLSDSELIARLLFERDMVLVASPAYLKKHGTPSQLTELKNHHGLMLGNSHSAPIWALGTGSDRHLIQFKPRAWANSSSGIKQMVRAGLGIALLTRQQCQQELNSGALVKLLPEVQIEPVKCYALYPSRMQLAPKISHFLEYITRHANFKSDANSRLTLVE